MKREGNPGRTRNRNITRYYKKGDNHGAGYDFI